MTTMDSQQRTHVAWSFDSQVTHEAVIDVGIVDTARREEAALDDDLDHCCSDEGRKLRAQYQLRLIEQLRIHEYSAMEHLDGLICEAGAKFARTRLSNFDNFEVPF